MLPVRFTSPRQALLNWDPFGEFGRLGQLFDECLDGVCHTATRGFEVDVRDVETVDFHDSKTGGVQGPHDRTVSGFQPFITV